MNNNKFKMAALSLSIMFAQSAIAQDAQSSDIDYDSAWAEFDKKNDMRKEIQKGSVNLPSTGDVYLDARIDAEAEKQYLDAQEKAGNYVGDQINDLKGKGSDKINDFFDKNGLGAVGEYITGVPIDEEKEDGEDTNDVEANTVNGVYVPPVIMPQSMCGTDIREQQRQFRENMRQQVCASIETEHSVADSPYSYESPESGCNFDMPGLPELDKAVGGRVSEGCESLRGITGEMIDAGVGSLNNAWNQGLGMAGDQIESATGISTDKWTEGVKDIVPGAISGTDVFDTAVQGGYSSGNVFQKTPGFAPKTIQDTAKDYMTREEFEKLKRGESSAN